MKASVFQKVTIRMPDGLRWPGIVATEPISQTVQNRAGIDVELVQADVISLRTPRDGGDPYLALTTETVTFGWSPVMQPRYDAIVGLDVDEDGALLDLQTLMDRFNAANEAFLRGRFEERHGVTAEADEL